MVSVVYFYIILDKRGKEMKRKHKKIKRNANGINVKDFFTLNQSMIVILFLVVLYVSTFLYSFVIEQLIINNKLERIPSDIINLTILYIVSAIITFIFCIVIYHRVKNIMKGLCYNVLLKCKIKEQYKRFEEIKKCIETFENESGKCDVKTNVNVISASIAFDSAKCIVYPILLTAATLVIPDSDELMSIRLIIGFPLFYAVMEYARGISRNAFIKKVIECISEEH